MIHGKANNSASSPETSHRNEPSNGSSLLDFLGNSRKTSPVSSKQISANLSSSTLSTISNSMPKIIDIQRSQYRQSKYKPSDISEDTNQKLLEWQDAATRCKPTTQTQQANTAWNSQATTSNYQQQQPKQTQQELPSSFESDYDLLVYLGETETEDIVDTERSLDYQDQTWRQSICGASLAPTIDESLSELLTTNSRSHDHQDFELLNSPSPNFNTKELAEGWSPNLSAPSVDVSGKNQINYQVPATSRLIDERDNEVLMLFPNQNQDNSYNQWNSSYSMRPVNEGLNHKYNLKPNDSRSIKSKTLGSNIETNANSKPSYQMADQVTYNQKLSSGQNTMSPRDAAELDRLLAEMSKSLDLDSLSKYDSRGETQWSTKPATLGRPTERYLDTASYSLGRDQPYKRSETSIIGLQRPGQSSNLKSSRSTNQVQTNDPIGTSILDEYDGASKILEEMIADQLEGNSQFLNTPRTGDVQPTRVNRTINTPRDQDIQIDSRKMSTCSSSVATEASVMAAPQSNRMIPTGLVKPRKLTQQMSLDLNQSVEDSGLASRHNIEALASSVDLKLSHDPPKIHNSHKERDSPPPKPPAIDYDDVSSPGGSDSIGVIKVEPSAIPSELSTSPETSPRISRSSPRRKSQVDRMKQRTLNSMRSMRDKFNTFLESNSSNGRSQQPESNSKDKKQQQQQKPQGLVISYPIRVPRPPQRSSSVGERSNSLYQGRDIETAITVPSQQENHEYRERESRSMSRRNRGQLESDGTRQSLGKQIRERLSRSKQRITEFLMPQGRRSKSKPSKATVENQEDSKTILFEPSDIARNSDVMSPTPGLRRGDSGDSFDTSLDRHLAASLNHKQISLKNKKSTSSSSSSLSGLDLSIDRRKSRSGSFRSPTLSPLRRLNSLRGQKPDLATDTTKHVDLDTMQVSTSNGLPKSKLGRRKKKRKGKKSSGPNASSDSSDISKSSKLASVIVSPPATTSDYFGQVPPTQGESPTKLSVQTNEIRTTSLQDLKSQIDTHKIDSDLKEEKPSNKRRAPTRSKSMSHMSQKVEERRLPAPTNSFRPASACKLKSHLSPDDSHESSPKLSGSVRELVTPIGPRNLFSPSPDLELASPDVVESSKVEKSHVIPIRTKSSALFTDLRHKCSSLFTAPVLNAQKHEPKTIDDYTTTGDVSQVPQKPPRRRQRAKSVGQTGRTIQFDLDDEHQVINVQTQSPDSTLGSGNFTSASPRSTTPGASTGKRLANLALQLKDSAVDFLSADAPTSRRGKTSEKSHRSNTTKQESDLCHWSPVITKSKLNTKEMQGASVGSQRTSFGTAINQHHGVTTMATSLAKAEGEANQTAESYATYQEQADRHEAKSTGDSIDATDSSWDSTSDHNNNQIVRNRTSTDADDAKFVQPVQDHDSQATGASASSPLAKELTSDGKSTDASEAKAQKSQQQVKEQPVDRLSMQMVDANADTRNSSDRIQLTSNKCIETQANHQRSKIPEKLKSSIGSKPNRLQSEATSHEFPVDLEQREVCKTPFKFNVDLPSPTQILYEQPSDSSQGNKLNPTKREPAPVRRTGDSFGCHQVVSQESHVQMAPIPIKSTESPAVPEKPKRLTAKDPNKLSLKSNDETENKEDESIDQNRLSVYENAQISTQDSMSPMKQGVNLTSNDIPSTEKTAEVMPSDLVIEEQQAIDCWSVSDTLERNSRGAHSGNRWPSRSVKEKLRRFDEQLAAIKAEELEVEERRRRQQVKADDIRPKPKMVAMTSIIQEPGDELMTASAKSLTQLNEPTYNQSQISSMKFQDSNNNLNNSDGDDTDSSFAAASVSRHRIVTKFDNFTQEETKQSKAKFPAFEDGKSALRFPSSSSSKGSMVNRLARNFERSAQEASASGSSRKPPVAPRPAKLFPNRQLSQVLSVDEDPKSESTWYDAKSIELLDEAEVAELLREFDDSPEPRQTLVIESVSSQISDLASVSTGAEPFVTVADSTLNESNHQIDNSNKEDSSFDEDTLNDEDDDYANDELEDDRTESYVSASANDDSNFNVQASRSQLRQNIKDKNSTSESKHNIDTQFKNSLNDIIARRSNSKELEGRIQRDLNITEGANSPMAAPASVRILTSDNNLIARPQTKIKPTRRHERHKQPKGMTSYYKALIRHCRHRQAHKHELLDQPKRPHDQVDAPIGELNSARPSSYCSSSGSSLLASSSAVSSSCPSAGESDDERSQEELVEHIKRSISGEKLPRSERKRLTRCAKKCSRIYGELEKILARKSDIHQIKSDYKNDNFPHLSNTNDTNAQETQTVNHVDGEDHRNNEANEIMSKEVVELTDNHQMSSSPSMSSSSSDNSLASDLSSNMQKLYFVVNEIYTSEAKFVDTLRLLNVDFRNHLKSSASMSSKHNNSSASINLHNSTTSSSLNRHHHSSSSMNLAIPEECITSMLKHLPQLQALNENLLEELKAARDSWLETRKISQVLVKIGPFLKHYSIYIREFEPMQKEFNENLKKYPQFAYKVREFEASLRSQKLTIQHHLLRPVQRIPQYRLLLQQYLHYLRPGDPDYEDTINALEVMSRVAEHANQSMKDVDNFAKLLAMQSKKKDLVQPGRLFIKAALKNVRKR